ncbi:MAG: polyprenyl diphosphate synthase [Weeksellaceae bacterium]
MEYSVKHIAIIPDGNRRWARNLGKSPLEGHKVAVEKTLPALYDEMLRLKVPYCTFWAMSPENFKKRSETEINNLLFLIGVFLQKRLKELHEKNIKILTIGDIAHLPKDTQKQIQTAQETTKDNTGLVFTIAINYGGRDEMVRSIQKIIESNTEVTEVTPELISQTLDTRALPDPDLIIRTGGEKRTSGFLLWQSDYAEYAFVDTLFPDFTPEMLVACIEEFEHRQRRFGK